MVNQADIIQAAALLIKEHGEDAWLEAAAKSTDLKKSGDLGGSQMWMRIADAIAALADQEPPAAGGKN